MTTDSTLVGHEACPECPSSDGFAVYDDGHGHCFVCGHHTPPENGRVVQQNGESDTIKTARKFIQGEPKALPKRKLSEDTAAKFGYQVAKHRGKTVQVAPYFDKQGRLVAQKVRDADKKFWVVGDLNKATLFGQQLWRDGGKRVVITEGEIDAMSLSQVQHNKWPVVSIPSGSNGAAKSIRKNIEWLEKFEEVVFMFDMDDPGREAVAECVGLFSPGKAKVASLPLKDANEMLVAGKVKELVSATWDAKTYKPDGIVSVADMKDRVYTDPEWGLSYPWKTMTESTYGIRKGELVAVGAGTGTGKSDFFKEIVMHLATEHDQNVGVVFLEEPVDHTIKCLMGKWASIPFHVPDSKYTQKQFDDAYNAVASHNRIHLYDHFGATDWDTIKSRIRYFAVGLECKYIFIDHVTMMVYGEEDERRKLDEIMEGLTSLTKELNINIHFVSHLTSPEKTPHEEGGRVTLKQLRGSRSIGQCVSFAVGLERDQQKRGTPTTVRILKDRYTGRSTGRTFGLMYEPTTGRVQEVSLEDYFNQEEDDGADDPF